MLLAFCSGCTPETPAVPESVSFPILLYHHIDAYGVGGDTIAEAVFLQQLDAIRDAGYHTITPEQMLQYVREGTPLPPKPILITFDDGYRSNYEIAYPALQARGLSGTIFLIGISVGADTYKDTGKPIFPHFSYAEAQEMLDSGVIDIQSHTYDMHQWPPLEPDGGRSGVCRRETEDAAAYLDALRSDFARSRTELEQNTTVSVCALAYPFGSYTRESEQVCRELGIPITFTTEEVNAVLRCGDPESLRLVGRYSVDDCSPEALLQRIAEETG